MYLKARNTQTQNPQIQQSHHHATAEEIAHNHGGDPPASPQTRVVSSQFDLGGSIRRSTGRTTFIRNAVLEGHFSGKQLREAGVGSITIL